MKIKVMGSGCRKCRSLLKATQDAVAEQGLSAEVEYVTDLRRIAECGVLSTPVLMVDGKVVSRGDVLEKEEIVPLLKGK